MTTKKKKLAIVFGITNDYSFALANVLIGMKRHHKKYFWDDIIVFHEDLPKKDQKLLNSILPCKFVVFDNSRVDVKKLNPVTVKTYSVPTLSRFYCFDLLNEYSKVIWHDVDILIQKDFSGLLKYGEKSGFALTQTDSSFYVESNFFRPIKGYSMYKVLYNAGIIVISDKLKGYELFTDWCFDKLNEIAPDIRWLDQGPLNLLIEEFNIDVEHIDILKYCCHPDRPTYKDAAIIHAYGSNKFWNSTKLQSQFPEWVKNNNVWQSIQKTTYEKHNEKVSIILSVYDRFDHLAESIQSLINQTYQNIEIIVVVEFSSKQKAVNKLLNKINNGTIIIVNNKKRLGFAESLNIGIKTSTGTFIARMDDDDISELNRIERQVEYLRDNPEIGIVGSYIQCFGKYKDRWDSVPIDPEECKAHMLFSTSLYHPTIMMRRNIIEKYNLYYDPNYFTEDYELWSRAIKYTKISNIPEYLVKYRTAENNITAISSDKVHNSHISVMKKQLKEYLNLNLNFDELQTINRRIDIAANAYHPEAVLEIRRQAYLKIVNANNKLKFYDKKALNKIIGEQSNSGTRIKIKKIAKKSLKPFLSRLERYILNRQINLESRVGKLESDISLLKND